MLLSDVGFDEMAVKEGDTIKVEYTGTLDDGTVFDSSEGHGPIEFKVGEGRVIPGFEKAVVGMEKGEEKDVQIKSDDAYGDPDPEKVRPVPRDMFPKEEEPKPGMMIAIGLPNGVQLPAKILEVGAEQVKIDLNHPLAGKALNFKLKVVEISA